MAHFLASAGDQQRTGWMKRFAPACWTVDFPRPMMAAVTAPDPGTLRLDLDFLTTSDLAGLVWESGDRWSHPLLAYRTDRDYRGVRLEFDWVAAPGLMPLDALNGAVLTIEGRDAEGVPRTWYVRLWNYAEGSPAEARIRLDFDALRAGFGPDGDIVHAADIDRLFISLVPALYDGSGVALAQPVSTHVELRGMVASGPRSTLVTGDAFLPEHGLRMASGYDDSYNQAPERLVAQWQALGYRGLLNHYVGMSHFPALADVGGGRYEAAGGLCASAVAWHAALFRALRQARMEPIVSLSFELFDAHAPDAWVQRDVEGNRALTGWEPPSTLLSPCNAEAVGWLEGIAASFCALLAAEGLPVRFQVGEPWWWVGPDGAPCFHDAATVSLYLAETGVTPPPMADVVGERSEAELLFLDWLGARLAAATAAVREAGRAASGNTDFVSHLLFYAPQVLDSARPEVARANMPTGWAFPEWDVLQLEDYSFVTEADEAGMARGRAAVAARLGYPVERQHYLAGFVLTPERAILEWQRIGEAAKAAMKRGVPQVFVWAWPQVARDGFQWTGPFVDEAGGATEDEEAGVQAFHDVLFPLEPGFEAVGGPEFATQVVTLASGHEQRNMQWSQARLRYDAGLGIRSEEDLLRLLDFFRARRGRAFGFRFRDPLDWCTAGSLAAITPFDQLIGVGDGARLGFPLLRTYGPDGMADARRISRPVTGSLRISVGGLALESGWKLLPHGMVQFDDPPGDGAEVRAGFAFDVPVRFATDRLDISLSGWRAGEPLSVPLVEVRE